MKLIGNASLRFLTNPCNKLLTFLYLLNLPLIFTLIFTFIVNKSIMVKIKVKIRGRFKE